MDGIALMVEEHKNIKRMLEVIRKACYGILLGREIEFNDFEVIIDFIRNYADRHHHGKEEKMLFNRMISEIGGAAEMLVKHGMLVEHDLGRYYIRELEEALTRVKNGNDESRIDVIANAVSYSQLLLNHIYKEDNVAYPLAKRQLNIESLEIINEECDKFEKEMAERNVQLKYEKVLRDMELKYIIHTS